jgi:hypothetical protein
MFGWIFGKKSARPKPGPPTLRASTAEPVEHGSFKKAPERQPAVQVLDFGSRMLSVPGLDFIGLYEPSPNGRFRVAWRDGDGNHSGARERGQGAYVLIDVDRVVAHGRMQRPNDGKVADNGNFILNDWRFTAELAGTFWAFRPDGSVILSKQFDANLFNNGLADDGALAACHTCNSSSETDSAILTLFDLDGAKELTRFRAESGWPSTYRFSKSPSTVVLGYSNDGGDFAYGLDGAFLDREAWIAARLKAGDLYLIRSLFQQADGVYLPDSRGPSDRSIPPVEPTLQVSDVFAFFQRERRPGLTARSMTSVAPRQHQSTWTASSSSR